MKKYIMMILATLLCTGYIFAGAKGKADKDTNNWRYEVENLGQRSGRGGHGTSHVLKVWSYSKKPVVAEEQSKKNAVHAVIFQGVPGNDAKRLKGIEALLQDPAAEAEHAGFFDKFFETGGDYMRFVTVSNSGMADILKYGKEYKVGLTVSVNTPALRKYLEQSGVIEAMAAGFDKAIKPSLMVVPSRRWCLENGYMNTYETMGETINMPDYRRAFDNDKQLGNVVAKIGGMMSSRGFDTRNMQAVLNSLQNESAEMMALQSKNGAMVEENMIDKLRKVAKADIWLEVDYSVNEQGMKKSITFNLSGIDAYTDEQIANCQGTGQPSYSSELAVLLEEAVSNNLDNFNEQLMAKFGDWFQNGRQIKVQIKRFDNCEYDLESEFDGDELRTILRKFMRANTVNHQFTTDISTENQMSFSNVRIPMTSEDEDEDAMDAEAFGNKIRKMLSKKYGLVSKVMPKGLGQVTVVIGDK